MLAAVLALAASVAALVAFVFWQGQELRSLRKSERKAQERASELKILNAAAEVAVADKEKAMNLLIAERDNLTDALDKVKVQRDELLAKTLEDGDPSTVAAAVRDALKRL